MRLMRYIISILSSDLLVGKMITTAVAIALFFLLMSSAVFAQESIGQFGVRVGSGLELGTGSHSSTVMRHTPVFIDLDIRTWTDPEGDFIFGGSLRTEVDGRASIGAVPRVEIRQRIRDIELRPGIGVPLFLAPFLMFGVEMGLNGRMDIGSGFGLVGAVTVGGFFLGNDVPKHSAVVMINGSIGIDIET
jgi:hypothetical protein